MANFELRHWPANASGQTRRERQPCDYRAYVPDPLVGRPITLDGEVAAEVADAERAIAQFNTRARALVDTEALARLLLRAESVASSRIEGLEIGPRRLLRAAAARAGGDASPDMTANEVLANIDAMAYGVGAINEGDPIEIELLLEMHRRLLATSQLSTQAGTLRTAQNWIGGSSYNPCAARFVPPPPEYVQALVADLCAYCTGDALPALAQAAVAHAQFETIHPFVDGNGRIGRALIHVVLRRRGLAPSTVPPISLILATRAEEYIDGLSATRYDGQPDGQEARDGLNLWISRFAHAARRAVADANDFEARIDELEREWRQRLGTIRRKSATDVLLTRLPALPILTVKSASSVINRGFLATNEAVARLVDHDIIRPVNTSRRNRAFEVPELIRAFADFERGLASPTGDTRVSPPTRRVPRRRDPASECTP